MCKESITIDNIEFIFRKHIRYMVVPASGSNRFEHVDSR